MFKTQLCPILFKYDGCVSFVALNLNVVDWLVSKNCPDVC